MWMTVIHLNFINYEQGIFNLLLLCVWRPGFNILQPFVSGKKGDITVKAEQGKEMEEEEQTKNWEDMQLNTQG